jgi:hypothetical protein
VFLAVLQRPQPAQRRQLVRLQRLARRQVRIQQAQQQARRQGSRCKGRPLRTPQKAEEHIRVRPRPRAQRQSERVKQLLRAFPSELVNERRVRNKSRGSQLRQVVAAKPERDLKVRKLRQSRALLVKRQRGRSVARRVSARLSLRRNLRETNNNSDIWTLQQISPARVSAGLFCIPKCGYIVVPSTAAVSAARYFTPKSHVIPDARIIADTNRNATCMFVCPPM